MRANKNILKLSPYVSLPHKVWDLEDKKDILKLDWNEASINPSPKVAQKVAEFLQNGHLNWYPNTKNQALIKALAKYTKQDEACVQIFASSDAAHEVIIDTFLEKEDKVTIISPTYDHFRARANGVGIETLAFHLDKNFDLNFDELEIFLKEKNVKFVYLCNPNNPTGKAYDLEKIKNLIFKFDEILFLIDEAYYEFCELSVQDIIKECKNLIITRTFSKAFALASFRIGYVISCAENIEALNKLRNPKSVAMPSQIAALAALEDVKYMKDYVDEVSLARSEFVKFLSTLTHGGGGVLS